MGDQSIIMRAFNQHLKDFVDDIQRLFPENVKVRAFKNSVETFIKMNPKKVIELWYHKITMKYSSEIMNEEIDFFLNKDYSQDVKEVEGTGINVSIDLVEELRGPIRDMNEEDRKMAVKYVKEMTQLSTLYFS
jgi:hypothetical protein